MESLHRWLRLSIITVAAYLVGSAGSTYALSSFPAPKMGMPQTSVSLVTQTTTRISWSQVSGATAYWLQVTNTNTADPANGNFRCTIGNVEGGITCS